LQLSLASFNPSLKTRHAYRLLPTCLHATQNALETPSE